MKHTLDKLCTKITKGSSFFVCTTLLNSLIALQLSQPSWLVFWQMILRRPKHCRILALAKLHLKFIMKKKIELSTKGSVKPPWLEYCYYSATFKYGNLTLEKLNQFYLGAKIQKIFRCEIHFKWSSFWMCNTTIILFPSSSSPRTSDQMSKRNCSLLWKELELGEGGVSAEKRRHHGNRFDWNSRFLYSQISGSYNVLTSHSIIRYIFFFN